MNPSRIISIDFETYYDNECSIKILGNMGYFSHPDFDAYLVTAAYIDTPEQAPVYWASDPRQFDWSLIEGATVLSHNSSFDQTLYLYGVSKGWWPSYEPKAWHCTADMAAFLGLPRNLAGASEASLGVKVSKDTRNNMKGKRWSSMTPEFQKEVVRYALKDAQLCLNLWLKEGGRWPEFERQVSELNRGICQNGIPVDPLELQTQLTELRKQLWNLEQAVPWTGYAKLLSRQAFNAECRKHGLEPPVSLAKGDPEALEWIKEHGDNHLWIGATTNWRRVNALVKKLESFDAATMPDERFYGSLLYFGAHTGRFSGSGGNLNLQNLPQGELFGVDMRALIHAKPGHKLVKVDLSQIEVRTVCWLAEDFAMLEEIRTSPDVYETFAIRFGLWSADRGRLAEEDPQLRSKPIKPMVLGCGFGAGGPKLALMFRMDEEEAAKAVHLYRDKMGKVVDLWGKYDRGLITACSQLQPYYIDLPSGRQLKYQGIKRHKEKYKVMEPYIVTTGPDTGKIVMREVERERMATSVMRLLNGKRVRTNVWGGVLTENAAQALARDIFVDRMQAVAEAGFKKNIILHVHDELVMEVPEDIAEDALKTAIDIMSTPPSWIPNLPLAADGKILDAYSK
jgi:hypothetical protein